MFAHRDMIKNKTTARSCVYISGKSGRYTLQLYNSMYLTYHASLP